MSDRRQSRLIDAKFAPFSFPSRGSSPWLDRYSPEAPLSRQRWPLICTSRDSDAGSGFAPLYRFSVRHQANQKRLLLASSSRNFCLLARLPWRLDAKFSRDRQNLMHASCFTAGQAACAIDQQAESPQFASCSLKLKRRQMYGSPVVHGVRTSLDIASTKSGSASAVMALAH